MRSVPESSPRDTKRVWLSAIRREGVEHVATPADARRVAARTEENEIVVHHIAPPDTVAGGNEGVLAASVMHEDGIDVAILRQLERLAAADRDDLDAHAVLALELRQDGSQQPRVVRAGGRREPQHVGRENRQPTAGQQPARQQQAQHPQRCPTHLRPPGQGLGQSQRWPNERQSSGKSTLGQTPARCRATLGAAATRRQRRVPPLRRQVVQPPSFARARARTRSAESACAARITV
jgi:hypothetical protein